MSGYYQGTYIIYITVMFIICLCTAIAISQETTPRLLKSSNTQYIKAWILSLGFALFLGFRPYLIMLSDTYGYAVFYSSGNFDALLSFSSEPIWLYFQKALFSIGCPTDLFIALITFLYIGAHFYVCRKWFGPNVLIALLFCFTTMSFYAYATNTLRCGMAAAVMLVAFSRYPLKIEKPVNLAIFVMLAIVAIGIHNSLVLSLLSFLAAVFVCRKTKYALCFWFLCVVLSLIIGSTMREFLIGFGFADDRFSGYINAGDDLDKMARNFSRTGFRWDFLAYSVVPIVWGCYVVMKRKITNQFYVTLLNTYILANSFWVLVITAQQSDRFAYISWYLYAFVLSYPLLKFNLLKKQGLLTAIFLMCQVLFITLMFLR